MSRHSSRCCGVPGPNRHRGGTLLGIFIGLVIGVLIAAGVVWYLNRASLPFQSRGEARPAEPARPVPPAPPAPLPGKPGDKVADKPRFEFYKILPDMQEPAPERSGKAADAKAELSGAEALYLQAGAFQSAADADNLKARLALMGVEASVQPVAVPDKGMLHRVRIGPYRSQEEMGKARSQLAQNGIPATVVRVKENQ